MMKVLVIPVNDRPYPKEIEDSLPGEYVTLEELQHLVDGFIEPCAPAELRLHNIELLANDEGLIRGLPCNINLFPFFFVGNVVAVGVGDEDFISLTPEQIAYLEEWLKKLQ